MMNTTMTEITRSERCPLFPVLDCFAFPGMSANIDIKTEMGSKILDRALDGDGMLFLLNYKLPITPASNLTVTPDNLEKVGTMVRIERAAIGSDPVRRVVVTGMVRGRLNNLVAMSDGTFDAEFVSTRILMEAGSPGALALRKELGEALERFSAALVHPLPEQFLGFARTCEDPGDFCDFLVQHLGYLASTKQHFLEQFDPEKRAMALLVWLESECRRVKLEKDIRDKVQARMDRSQREYQLREQMRVIKSELGEGGEEDDEEIEEYRARIAEASLPDEVREKLTKEVGKLAKTPYSSAESTVLRQYLDTVLELPWGKYSTERRSVARAKRQLDKDHSGMEQVKERILEYIAVRTRNPELKNQILCFVGAPGTGKTSVSASIASSLGRKFVRVCLGGIRDEAEIRGHRKTYVGAMPGRIVTALKQAGVMNPVILFDEIDKMESGIHGNPAAAMLEVLDAEQNKAFRDHFLELPMDLSDCIFIATANTRRDIPAPLLDRMELIELPPYLRTEKLAIAKEHLIPKQLTRHGLTKKEVRIDDKAILRVIDEYTAEGGVRNLEREIARICRKCAKRFEDEGDDIGMLRVGAGEVEDLLGPGHTSAEKLEAQDEVGIVSGLAWTENGGTMLKVEAQAMPGSGKVVLSGSLGEVMKESAGLAVSYLRAHASELAIDPDFYKNLDLHIHLPEGAVPKDGPSAGVTLTTALVSELSHCPVKRDVAMTGEISLRGKVLPIGGLREKATAAYAAGVKTVIIPDGNRADLVKLPEQVKNAMTFVPVKHVSQVLQTALVQKETHP